MISQPDRPILIVGPNPARDQTSVIVDLIRGGTHRLTPVADEYAGKAWNTAVMAARLGVAVTYLTFGFSDNAEIPSVPGLTLATVDVEAPLRQNWKLKDSGNITTEFNQSGGPISRAESEALLHQHHELVKGHSLVLYCGSLPRGFEPHLLADMIREAEQVGCFTMLDSSGDALKQGLGAGVSFIKPNLIEFSELVGREYSDLGNIREEVEQLFAEYSDLEQIVVTAGSSGSLSCTRTEALRCEALTVPVSGTIGAGDSMMAGLAVARFHHYSHERSLKLGTACSGASVQVEGTGLGRKDEVNALLDRVVIHHL